MVNKYIFWAPRVLGILFVLFLMMFSLDVFEPGRSITQIAVGLFMHNIPALFLFTAVILSWKYEIIGGIAFILAGVLYILTLVINSRFEWYMLSWSAIIAGPAFLIGALFLISWYKKYKKIGQK